MVLRKPLLFILLFSLLLAGCSSNRFIEWQTQAYSGQVTSPLSTQQILKIHDLTSATTKALNQHCKAAPQNPFALFKALTACHLLLSNVTQDQQPVISAINKKLLSLLSSIDLNASPDSAHFAIKIDNDILGQAFERIYLTQAMVAKETELTPRVFPGLGITGVAMRSNSGNLEDSDFPLEGIFRPLTFIIEEIRFSDGDFQIVISGKRLSQTTPHPQFNGINLAYSPAAAFLTLINIANIDKSSFQGLLTAEKADHRFGIFAVEEFNTEKTPVLMVHGLQSSPLIWRKLTVAILNNPDLHGRYQIWHAFYPSGPPPFYNAMRLRKTFDTLISRFPQDSPAASSVNLIGHSMGGIIAKTFAVNSERALWDVTFSQPPEFFYNEPLVAQEMKDIFIFQQLNDVDNLFFLDTPHKGSEVARSWIGHLGAGLINLPEQFTNLFSGIIGKFGLDIISPPMRPFLQYFGPNSIEVLRPGHPLMNELNNLELPENTWSIVGSDSVLTCDPEADCNNLSDGVVTWSSATSPAAKEEIIVQSNHDSFNNEQAIAFILDKLEAKPTIEK